jgi:hypothetical protein
MTNLGRIVFYAQIASICALLAYLVFTGNYLDRSIFYALIANVCAIAYLVALGAV